MKYKNIKRAKFLERPNRFVAYIEMDGKREICHVKNTGRCKELLIPGVTIYVQSADNPNRKTPYDLIAVNKGDRIVNIDSQVPNKVFAEWVRDKEVFGGLTLLRPEKVFANSRFDFYLEAGGRKIFVEVKGVTLEEKGVALFPDAPTERGIKHIQELEQAVLEGYEAYIFFIIQMKGIKYFSPNYQTYQAFGDALVKAARNGVKVLAFDCDVTPDSITAGDYIDVKF